MNMIKYLRHIAGDLLDDCPWTADDYGGETETFVTDLLIETDGRLRWLNDDQADFLFQTLVELAGEHTDERSF